MKSSLHLLISFSFPLWSWLKKRQEMLYNYKRAGKQDNLRIGGVMFTKLQYGNSLHFVINILIAQTF
ncbi:hypothetical protein DLD82_09060 [Methanospirillum stamsii]|uniref:Uncharacterized protein n=1 Tax=Methanospirillum stamsii TaxID=1277351 RepID=A0A2V2NDL9_9EURY|nr:hypothetical protein DLD82_09060 [Methanospirillum stamsii]